jgi:hypothetical protein
MMPHLMCFYDSVLEDGGGAGQGEGGVIDDVRKLGEHILTKGWQTVTDRDVTQAVKRWRYRGRREKADRYATLEAMGWLMAAQKPDQFGIAARYLVNPAVHTVFADKARRARESMKLVAELLAGSVS